MDKTMGDIFLYIAHDEKKFHSRDRNDWLKILHTAKCFYFNFFKNFLKFTNVTKKFPVCMTTSSKAYIPYDMCVYLFI